MTVLAPSVSGEYVAIHSFSEYLVFSCLFFVSPPPMLVLPRPVRALDRVLARLGAGFYHFLQ